uniref:Carboxypeptidase n=1 Tax=Leersia perrieri TaxID=77586 RepID=A0A0D9VUU6_9ORYZ
MEKRHWVLLISVLSCLLLVLLSTALSGESAAAAIPNGRAGTITAGTADGSEMWGYVAVRPKANVFWWYYKSPETVSSSAKPWPTVLWLQGGPGGSGVGRGNFQEVGMLDTNLNPRNFTWLSKADLIFVGDTEAVADAIELLKALAGDIPMLPSSPLFLVGESYGGKHAAMIGVSVVKSINAGELNITLGGVVIGDGWISPGDFALSYPWSLSAVSRLDDNAVGKAIGMAVKVKQLMEVEQFTAAYRAWVDLLDLISIKSGGVNIENFMIDNNMGQLKSDLAERHLSSGSNNNLQASSSSSNTIDGIMNGIIKKKLKIIPEDLVWQSASLKVDELLSLGVNVTIYNGQVNKKYSYCLRIYSLDIICSTIGAEAWVRKLKWSGLHDFLIMPRSPLHFCHPYYLTNAFVRSYKNLNFYWVLGAGHMVPVDQPCTALHIIGSVTQSPADI